MQWLADKNPRPALILDEYIRKKKERSLGPLRYIDAYWYESEENRKKKEEKTLMEKSMSISLL